MKAWGVALLCAAVSGCSAAVKFPVPADRASGIERFTGWYFMVLQRRDPSPQTGASVDAVVFVRDRPSYTVIRRQNADHAVAFGADERLKAEQLTDSNIAHLRLLINSNMLDPQSGSGDRAIYCGLRPCFSEWYRHKGRLVLELRDEMNRKGAFLDDRLGIPSHLK